MPKGYLVGELEVTNPAGYAEYSRQVPAIIAEYGGRYHVRGGDAKLLEGAGEPAKRLVVVEFDSPERLMEFYNSPSYQAILPYRLNNSTGRVICVAGFDPG